MNLPQPEMIKKNKNFCLSLSRSHTRNYHVAYICNCFMFPTNGQRRINASHYCLCTSVFSENKCVLYFFFFLLQTPKNSYTGKMIISFSTQKTVFYPLYYIMGDTVVSI